MTDNKVYYEPFSKHDVIDAFATPCIYCNKGTVVVVVTRDGNKFACDNIHCRYYGNQGKLMEEYDNEKKTS